MAHTAIPRPRWQSGLLFIEAALIVSDRLPNAIDRHVASRLLLRRRGTPSQQHPPGIAILRDTTGRLALFINGQRSDRGGQGQLA